MSKGITSIPCHMDTAGENISALYRKETGNRFAKGLKTDEAASLCHDAKRC